MKKSMHGFREVFSFTLTQQLHSKGYRIITILLTLLLFLLPACIMPAVEAFGSKGEPTSTDITNVYVVDRTYGEHFRFSVFNSMENSIFKDISYLDCADDFAIARTLLETEPHSILLLLDTDDNGFLVHLLRSDDTKISDRDIDAYENFLNENFQYILLAKSGLSEEQLAKIYTPTYTTIQNGTDSSDDADTEDPFASIRKVLSYVLPYLNIMVLYFLVLYYGQSVANNVIMEKTSKLMDTFLVAVKPGAMIFGKVLAIVLSSILQFTLWVVALIGGFIAGTHFVRMINPDTDMLLVQFFDSLSDLSGVFTISGAVIALLIVFAAFLLYCALASVGGSLASKPEDLSSTNVLFTMILIVSFFCTLYAGGLSGNMRAGLTWLDLVPFTSIMVTPSRLLLGMISIWEGLLSLGILIITTLLCVWFAGRLYKVMSLYKGNLLKPAEVLQMMKNSAKDE